MLNVFRISTPPSVKKEISPSVVALCVSLVWVISLLGIWNNTPAITSPWPLATEIVGLFVGAPLFVSLIYSFGFLLLCRKVLRSFRGVSWRYLVVVAILGFLNFYHLYVSWEYGLMFNGKSYTRLITLLSASTWVILAVLVIIMIGFFKSSIYGSLSVLTSLFCWLGFFAFPYIGELI